MARPLRIEFPGAIYHTMSRGNGRQRIFRDARGYGRFLEGLDPVTVNFGGHKQAGNGGSFRGSLRAERLIRPSDVVGFEVSHRETGYLAPNVLNSARIYHFRARVKF